MTAGHGGRRAVEPEPTIRLTRLSGTWSPDDPHAAFKEDVAATAVADPLETLRGLSELTGVDVGALARYVLVRWASDGAASVLRLGPRLVERMAAIVEQAAGGDEATRAAAFDELADLVRRVSLAADPPPDT